ncbi:ADP-ribosylglycohydrolase family protein [Paraburkholderia sacchari]|uniref:Crystallin n=1 Tax=Paraburkholderia sacchari TaxID=159450 RepID=A0A8T6ZAB2_9BURK|nr:ADP-ribosylglycohydrolase family protein [Paraburkholderia sacchari]NLP62097.1 hypothetical protein [Paraburkholderia sacchari]
MNGYLSLVQTVSATGNNIYSRKIAGLLGLLIGDSLGVPFEFKRVEQIPARELIDICLPTGYNSTYPDIPYGTWSDDGSQALCLLASLLDCGQLSLNDFSDRLLRWIDDGYMAIDGHVFDIGIQTAEALNRLRDGVSPLKSGGSDERSNGNGSLMRLLPLALLHTGSDDVLVQSAHRQSLPTHSHPRSLVACGYYALVARGYLNQVTTPWEWADEQLEAVYRDWRKESERSVLLVELEGLRQCLKINQPCGTGYVLDTLVTARRAMEEGSFDDVVKTAISFGNDTDTTSAVAGGLAGIKFGVEGLPATWLQGLRGFEIVEPVVAKWLALSTDSDDDQGEQADMCGIGPDGVPIALVNWDRRGIRRRATYRFDKNGVPVIVDDLDGDGDQA